MTTNKQEQDYICLWQDFITNNQYACWSAVMLVQKKIFSQKFNLNLIIIMWMQKWYQLNLPTDSIKRGFTSEFPGVRVPPTLH